MTRFTIETNVQLSLEEVKAIQEVVLALIQTGGLLGVKGGSTNIHFDGDGVFQGIQFDYWPWRRRKKKMIFQRSIDIEDEEQLTNRIK